jgi:spermidine synthase
LRSPGSPARPRVYARQTRHGVELRVDGTLASLHRPGHVTTGPVWDALAAPLLALPPRQRRRVLILGLAGGSVARVARALAPGAAIVGVDYDREVLAVARRELALGDLDLELVVDDAVRYLERERRTFDLVVEDVMIGTARRPHRPPHLLERYELVHRRVARGGVLAANTIHDTPAVARLLARRPGTLVSFRIRDHYNQVLAVGPRTLSPDHLRPVIAADGVLAASLPGFQLRTLRA